MSQDPSPAPVAAFDSDDAQSAPQPEAKLAGPNTLLGRAHDLVAIERAVAEADGGNPAHPPGLLSGVAAHADAGPSGLPNLAAGGEADARPNAAERQASSPRDHVATRVPTRAATPAPYRAWPRVLLAVLTGLVIAAIGLTVFILTRR